MATPIDIGMPPARSIQMADAKGVTDPDWDWDGKSWMVGLISSTPHQVVQVEWDRTVGAGLVTPIGSPGGPLAGIYWDNNLKSWMKPARNKKRK